MGTPQRISGVNLNTARALNELSAAGHDVRAMQILDPAELSLDHFGRPAMWEDLESGETRYVDPAFARPAYQQRFAEHAAAVRGAFDQAQVDRQVIPTNEPLDRALLRFLRSHSGRARRTVRARKTT
jgi:hypothetical protein